MQVALVHRIYIVYTPTLVHKEADCIHAGKRQHEYMCKRHNFFKPLGTDKLLDSKNHIGEVY